MSESLLVLALFGANMSLGEAAVSPTAPLVVATRAEVIDTLRLADKEPVQELQSALWLDIHGGRTGKRAGPYFDLSLGYTGGPAYSAPSFGDGYISWRAGIGAARRIAAWYYAGSGALVATSGVEVAGPNGAWWRQGPGINVLAGLRLMTGFHAAVQSALWYTMVPISWSATLPGVHIERLGHRVRFTVSYKAISVGLRATTAALYVRDAAGKWRDLGERSLGLILQWRPRRHGIEP